MRFHVITVHWLSDQWLGPQLRQISEFMPSDTVLYASLNGVDRTLWAPFHYADELPGNHGQKLNALASIASENADPDDLLIFMDGDAFPIAPITEDILNGMPLVAVRRDENLGDPQPHPCFCVTTVDFWNRIGGDWRQGYTWVNHLGYRTSDVGGNLLGQLREHNVAWQPLLRSNKVNLHPIWFGIYGDVVYHHGAGFRERLARATLQLRRARVPQWIPLARRMDKRLAIQAATERRREHPPETLAAELALSDEILNDIRKNPNFYERFTREA